MNRKLPKAMTRRGCCTCLDGWKKQGNGSASTVESVDSPYLYGGCGKGEEEVESTVARAGHPGQARCADAYGGYSTIIIRYGVGMHQGQTVLPCTYAFSALFLQME